MAVSQKQELRALNEDERELIAKSHHPVLQKLSDDDLSKLVKLMRERRSKAKAAADQRRREMRGKSSPKGASPSRADEGSKLKVSVLAMAVRRLNSEVERRRKLATKTMHLERALHALARKQESATKGPAFNTRTAHEGMRNAASQRRQNLIRPMELGRQRKAAAIAQAKRDAR